MQAGSGGGGGGVGAGQAGASIATSGARGPGNTESSGPQLFVTYPVDTTPPKSLTDQISAQLAALTATGNEPPSVLPVPVAAPKSNATLYVILVAAALAAYFIFRKKRGTENG